MRMSLRVAAIACGLALAAVCGSTSGQGGPSEEAVLRAQAKMLQSTIDKLRQDNNSQAEEINRLRQLCRDAGLDPDFRAPSSAPAQAASKPAPTAGSRPVVAAATSRKAPPVPLKNLLGDLDRIAQGYADASTDVRREEVDKRLQEVLKGIQLVNCEFTVSLGDVSMPSDTAAAVQVDSVRELAKLQEAEFMRLRSTYRPQRDAQGIFREPPPQISNTFRVEMIGAAHLAMTRDQALAIKRGQAVAFRGTATYVENVPVGAGMTPVRSGSMRADDPMVEQELAFCLLVDRHGSAPSGSPVYVASPTYQRSSIRPVTSSPAYSYRFEPAGMLVLNDYVCQINQTVYKQVKK